MESGETATVVAVAQLVASVVLVGVTIVYVLLTRSIARSTTQQARLFERQLAVLEDELALVTAQPVLAVRPALAVVAVSVGWRGEELARVQFEVVNLGAGAASGVRIQLDGCGWSCDITPVDRRRGPVAVGESRVFDGSPRARLPRDIRVEDENRLDFRIECFDLLGNAYPWRQRFGVVPNKPDVVELDPPSS